MFKRLKALFQRSKPNETQELVQKLRAACASLLMERDECVWLAPAPGMFGPVLMWGSINPSFEFQAFDYDRKEYMVVRVEVSSPDRLRFSSRTADEGYDATHHLDHKLIAIEFFKYITEYFPLTLGHKVKRTPDGISQASKSSGEQAVQNEDRQEPGTEGLGEVHRPTGDYVRGRHSDD